VTLLLLFALIAPQQDQTPRPLQKDARGLLKVDPIYFDLAANTGGDIYFWAPGEFASSHLQVPLPQEPVVLAYGTSEGTKVFYIPVESGKFAVTAHVQPGDGGAHAGRFQPSTCNVPVSGVKDAQVTFVAVDGSEIGTASATDCRLPDVPFRAAVRGSDAAGAAFQRIESAVHLPEKK